MKIKFWLAGVLVATGMSAAGVAYAVTPTVSLYGVGNDAVQITVSGDANSSAVMFYNVGASTGAQVSILGVTDAAGSLIKSLSVSGLGLDTSRTIYVMLNSQQSAVLPWANTGATASTAATTSAATTATNTGGVTFDVPNPVVAVGSSVTVNITSSGNGFYVSASTNLDATTTRVNEKLVTITGLANGSNKITICSVTNICGDINVTVGSASSGATTASTISFNVTNPAMVVGDTMNVTISGSTNYFVSTNSNGGAVQASITGSTLKLVAIGAGSASINICAASGGCAILPVTVTAVGGVVTSTITPNNSLSLLATIQTMQIQLAQMLITIEAMQKQLAVLAASASPVVSTSASATGSGSSSAASVQFSGSFTSFLKLDSTGAEVTALQKKLTKEGFYSGPITGTFGPLTEAAVKKYQSAKGLDSAGYVGPSTRAALNAQ